MFSQPVFNAKKKETSFIKLLDTNATLTDFRFSQIKTTLENPLFWKIVDNQTGDIVKSGEIVNGSQGDAFSTDLSGTSGNCALYVSEGNGIYEITGYWNKTKPTTFNFDAVPNLQTVKSFYMTNVGVLFYGSPSNLISFHVASGSCTNLDLSESATTLVSLHAQVTSRINVDLFTELTYLNVDYDQASFDLANHKKLTSINYKLDSGIVDSRLNCTFLPALTQLILVDIPLQDINTTIRDFSKLTSLTIKCNDIIFSNLSALTYLNLDGYDFNGMFSGLSSLKTLNLDLWGVKANLNFSGLTALTQFDAKYMPSSVTSLDLKPLTALKIFTLNYSSAPTVATIDIKNGLNTQITRFQSKYSYSPRNVIVDNPVAANAELAPYTTNIWSMWNNSYS